MVLFIHVFPDFYRLLNPTFKSTCSADPFPHGTQNSWSQTTLVTISHIDGPQLLRRMWCLVFLQRAVSYYFRGFCASAARTWINNRHQIPPSFKRAESFCVMCQFCRTKNTDKGFKSSFPRSIHYHFSVFWCNLDIANPFHIWQLPVVSEMAFSFLESHSRSELNTKHRLCILAQRGSKCFHPEGQCEHQFLPAVVVTRWQSPQSRILHRWAVLASETGFAPRDLSEGYQSSMATRQNKDTQVDWTKGRVTLPGWTIYWFLMFLISKTTLYWTILLACPERSTRGSKDSCDDRTRQQNVLDNQAFPRSRVLLWEAPHRIINSSFCMMPFLTDASILPLRTRSALPGRAYSTLKLQRNQD